mmetsp:Transcript_142425/g.248430  ORF Transcript_142425/g.248430 Transcript_142425/m.248430 type:complete len:97 (+) Transcript_142425:1206-1496(+)
MLDYEEKQIQQSGILPDVVPLNITPMDNVQRLFLSPCPAFLALAKRVPTMKQVLSREEPGNPFLNLRSLGGPPLMTWDLHTQQPHDYCTPEQTVMC